MEIALGIMLTTVALYSEAETPLGSVGFLQDTADGETDDVAQGKLGMQTEVANAFRTLEMLEQKRERNQAEALQLSMRRLADEHDSIEGEGASG